MKESQILTKVKTELQNEQLKASPQVKANLTQAFRAKHRSGIVVAMNKGIPLWQVAASLLLVISAVWWWRPFERQTIVEAEPTIKIEEKIVTVVDTIVVEKPVIQYVEVPSTTKTTIEKRVEDDQPMAYENPLDKTIFKPTVDLETLIDSYYDTAMVENIEGHVRGQSRESSGIPSFEVNVY